VTYCQFGCSDADHAPFWGRCIDCGREYQSGKPRTEQCPACEEAEDRRYRLEASGDSVSPTGYTADMRKKGAARKAADALAVKK